MTDHHDFGDHDFGYDAQHDPLHDPLEHETPPYEPPDDHLAWDDGPHHDPAAVHDAGVHEAAVHEAGVHEEPVADEPADHADVTEPPADTHQPDMSDVSQESVFPPPVDVGDLPEPVDGFPWIDTGSLGTHEIAAAPADGEQQTPPPAELAEYAATDLPPGAEPWAVLADSDDPATAALAKWWSRN
ncbi:hypothetical protein ACQP2F_24145 [Actinoplanes sp. CA-030573]|uniref:hypothetical protein n=1 Tax=Actinoplanes sp. CA-030573 TaxID=3239898 RepID=UPI003D9357AE